MLTSRGSFFTSADDLMVPVFCERRGDSLTGSSHWNSDLTLFIEGALLCNTVLRRFNGHKLRNQNKT